MGKSENNWVQNRGWTRNRPLDESTSNHSNFFVIGSILKKNMFRKVQSLYFSLLVLIDCDYDSDYLSGFGQSYYKFGHFGGNERFWMDFVFVRVPATVFSMSIFVSLSSLKPLQGSKSKRGINLKFIPFFGRKDIHFQIIITFSLLNRFW